MLGIENLVVQNQCLETNTELGIRIAKRAIKNSNVAGNDVRKRYRETTLAIVTIENVAEKQRSFAHPRA